VDVDHEPGKLDRSFRPNQVLALGGLPFPVVDGKIARTVVDRVAAELLTPLGLRTLACWEPGYVGHYGGGPGERDRAYHQGTAWPWLLGPFVEAWLRVRGDTPSARRTARERFVSPWLAHLETAGIGHVSEIVDGDFPHAPRGAPFQAWSLGELLRVLALLESDRRLG
jgi:glycogen debranching enzyme